jgi:ribose transport system substrate-binding protein
MNRKPKSYRRAFWSAFCPILTILPILSLLILAIFPAACSSGKKAESAKALKIAVIPKGMTHEFWNAIHAGAVKAGRELGVEVIWKGAIKEDDREGQIIVVEDMINRGVDGIVLAPLDNKALVRPVEEARHENIPVVIIDSPLDGSGYVSYIATDNYKGGVLGAQRLGQLLGGKGKIFLIRCLVGSMSSDLREQGFLETMQKEYPAVEFLSKDIYAGVLVESAFQTLENLLNRFPEVDGIFCPNESTSFGTLRALESKGLAGKIKFVGFDSSQKLVDGIRQGYIQGLVVQNPFNMGYLGVKTVVAHLRGEPVEAKIDTGETLVTPENMDQPEIKALLFPDVKTYLQ